MNTMMTTVILTEADGTTTRVDLPHHLSVPFAKYFREEIDLEVVSDFFQDGIRPDDEKRRANWYLKEWRLCRNDLKLA